jgi:hypothetical protein
LSDFEPLTNGTWSQQHRPGGTNAGLHCINSMVTTCADTRGNPQAIRPIPECAVMPRLASLRLAPKIGLSIALFLLPVTLILVLLASLQNKYIEFASLEVVGTRALAVLGNLQAGVDRGRAKPARDLRWLPRR